MKLLLTNNQTVVTMDYTLTGEVGSDGRPLYHRENTYISYLWYGPSSKLPQNGIEYNFVNGGKVQIVKGYQNNTVEVKFYNSEGKKLNSGLYKDNKVIYLTYVNNNCGTYDAQETGLPGIGIGSEEYLVSDVEETPIENNHPMMIEMMGRGYDGKAYNDPLTPAVSGTLSLNNISNKNYLAIAEGSQAPSDPYFPGGSTEPGGGTGTFDDNGELIGIPGLPTLSAVSAGFITLFNPTVAQLKNLASYMWSDLFNIDGWKKIFADPMDAILGLSIVPVEIPSPTTQEVKVGNIPTGVNMSVAESQYVEVDCGTLNVQEFWGSYLDYSPYTKAEIYLPYCGIHPISVDEIMNKTVRVVYHIDILSGACCAFVECGGTVLYSFVGQCSSSIPITGDNWTNVINGAISIAGSIGSMVSSGGMSAPMAISQVASTAVNTMKPSIEKSGSMGGTGGMLGVQKPYLILSRPRQALPNKQNTFSGYPSFITEQLKDLSGYTEIESIHLENVPATEAELSEIESLLKGGVIF